MSWDRSSLCGPVPPSPSLPDSSSPPVESLRADLLIFSYSCSCKQLKNPPISTSDVRYFPPFVGPSPPVQSVRPVQPANQLCLASVAEASRNPSLSRLPFYWWVDGRAVTFASHSVTWLKSSKTDCFGVGNRIIAHRLISDYWGERRREVAFSVSSSLNRWMK